MTASGSAYAGDKVADSGFGHWVAVRRGVLVLYFISLGVWSAHYGIPVQRELVIAWVCGALACASLGRPWRGFLRLVRDWLRPGDRLLSLETSYRGLDFRDEPMTLHGTVTGLDDGIATVDLRIESADGGVSTFGTARVELARGER